MSIHANAQDAMNQDSDQHQETTPAMMNHSNARSVDTRVENTMTKVETKNRKKNSEEAESFEIHGPQHFKGCPACQGVTDEHNYGKGCRLNKNRGK